MLPELRRFHMRNTTTVYLVSIGTLIAASSLLANPLPAPALQVTWARGDTPARTLPKRGCRSRRYSLRSTPHTISTRREHFHLNTKFLRFSASLVDGGDLIGRAKKVTCTERDQAK